MKELKICSVCGREFPNTNEYFHWRNKENGRLHCECKECKNNYVKQQRQLKNEQDSNGGINEMNNIQVINDEVKIDWGKFKSKAMGKVLEKARQSYIDLCIMMHSNGHTLLSDYTTVNNYVTIDMGCGHEPIQVSATYYKAINGKVECPECTINKYDQMILSVEEEPKYNKDVYTIGFYNDKFDDVVKLCNCNRVFNDIKSLMYHVRDNDIVVLASKFSLYGIDKQELQRIKDTYNIKFRIGSTNIDEKFNSMLNMNEFIHNNKDMISKIIN